MSRSTSWWPAVATSLFVFVWAGSAAAATEDQRGIDPNQGKSLVEVTLPSKGAATRLQLDAESYGIDFNEHYLRRNTNGTVTATVFGSDAELDARPRVRMTGPHRSRTPVETTFEWLNEPSVIRYTTDGSKPRASSRLWDSTGPREPGETFQVRRTTTFRWIAEDIKGNVSTGKQTFVIGRGGGGGDDDSDSDSDR